MAPYNKSKPAGGGYNWRKHLGKDNPDYVDDETWYGMKQEERDGFGRRSREDPEWAEKRNAYREEKRAKRVEEDRAVLASIHVATEKREVSSHFWAMTPS